ncbi:MAG: GyrI-like domain-containing protein [Erysipelothrix sp.]
MLHVIEETIVYIEENLTEDITVEEVAQNANYSVFYLQRLFSKEMGMGIKEYIRNRRLTRAAFELIHSDVKVIDVAIKYGFKTSESFTKAFRKQHQTTPSHMKEYQDIMNAFSNAETTRKELKKMKVRIENKESYWFTGHKFELSFTNNENLKQIPQLWDDINEHGFDKKLIKLNDGSIEGIIGLCMPKNDETMNYWIGTTTKDKNNELESIEIAASRYAVFEAIGPLPGSVQRTWKEITEVWIPSSGYQVDGSMDMEVYTDEDPMDPNLVTEIWIKIK